MALGPRLDLRQTQSLVMTPQLQQAIKLLTLSNLELETFIGEALEANPLLDIGEAAGGDVPDLPITEGCVYRARCPISQDRCAVDDPELVARDRTGRPVGAPGAVRERHATACLFSGGGPAS